MNSAKFTFPSARSSYPNRIGVDHLVGEFHNLIASHFSTTLYTPRIYRLHTRMARFKGRPTPPAIPALSRGLPPCLPNSRRKLSTPCGYSNPTCRSSES